MVDVLRKREDSTLDSIDPLAFTPLGRPALDYVPLGAPPFQPAAPHWHPFVSAAGEGDGSAGELLYRLELVELGERAGESKALQAPERLTKIPTEKRWLDIMVS